MNKDTGVPVLKVGRCLVILMMMGIISACVQKTEGGFREEGVPSSGVGFESIVKYRSDPVYELGRPVGLLSVIFRDTSSKNCTAFSVRNDLILTAAHCLRSGTDWDAVFRITFHADFDSDIRSATEYDVSPQPVAIDTDHDYALLALHGRLPDGYFFKISGETRRVEAGRRLMVIHHPGASPKQLTLGKCRALDSGNDETLNHSCATLIGSSGAPVLLAENGQVIGLHTGGPTVRLTDEEPNVAISIASIERRIGDFGRLKPVRLDRTQRWSVAAPRRGAASPVSEQEAAEGINREEGGRERRDDCNEVTSNACAVQFLAALESDPTQIRLSETLDALQSGCNRSVSRACNVIGYIYTQGIATEIDKDGTRSEPFFQKSCNLGYKIACENLAIVYYTQADNSEKLEFSYRVMSDFCEQGSNKSCYHKSIMINRAHNRLPLYNFINDTIVDAARIWSALCEENFRNSCLQLAAAHAYQYIEIPDAQFTINTLEMECDEAMPSSYACGALGEALRRGKILPRAPKRALTLYEKSCRRGEGFLPSCFRVFEMIAKGELGSPIDNEKAITFLKFGCPTGQGQVRHINSCKVLGLDSKTGRKI